MAQQLEHLKWIQGTAFMVDGFRFQNPRCTKYFLTHFHADHTTGLYRSFDAGTIYCSAVTANLLKYDMRMPPERIHPLPMDEPVTIDGITVTLMSANHCPGAVMMLFQVPQPGSSKVQTILHTGDMRWQSWMQQHPALASCQVDLLYMDTTYCLPKHTFPSQKDAIAKLVTAMEEAYAAEPSTLFVIGSYHIGKERAFFSAAQALGFRIWCDPGKKKVLQWCQWAPEDMARLVSQPEAAQIHVVFMGAGLQPEALQQRIDGTRWSKVVAFRPTGWSFQKRGLQTRREGKVTIYGIPYSEHSNWNELRDCVKLLRPRRIIPTVNAPNPTAARRVVDRFADLMDLSGDKSRLDMYFGRAKSAPAADFCTDICTDANSAPAEEFCTVTCKEAKSAPIAELCTEICTDAEQGPERLCSDAWQQSKVDPTAREAEDGFCPGTQQEGVSPDSTPEWGSPDTKEACKAGGSKCCDPPVVHTATARPDSPAPDATGASCTDQKQPLAPVLRDVFIDIEQLDVAEQRRLLAAIARQRDAAVECARQLKTHKRQATLGSFFSPSSNKRTRT